jgi:hypothetical protein
MFELLARKAEVGKPGNTAGSGFRLPRLSGSPERLAVLGVDEDVVEVA